MHIAAFYLHITLGPQNNSNNTIARSSSCANFGQPVGLHRVPAFRFMSCKPYHEQNNRNDCKSKSDGQLKTNRLVKLFARTRLFAHKVLIFPEPVSFTLKTFFFFIFFFSKPIRLYWAYIFSVCSKLKFISHSKRLKNL